MYTEEDIRLLLERSSDNEILAHNTKAALTEMYRAIYGYICFPSSWRKQNILNALREYFSNAARTDDLIKRYCL